MIRRASVSVRRRARGPVLAGLALASLLLGVLLLGDGVPSSFAASGFAASGFAASGDDRGVELLERAEEAAVDYDFAGEILVEWRAEDRLRHERVPVREAAGVLRVGSGQQLIGVGGDRFVGSEGDWERLWRSPPPAADAAHHDVRPDRKYVLDVRDGPEVAGRDTTVIEARRGKRVSERFAVDDVTGLLLRREQLDRRGEVERAVGFVELSAPRLAVDSSNAKVPRVEGAAPRPLADFPPGFTAPTRLGTGFLLVGRYRSGDGGVHLFYTDGIYSASVFEQPGELDVSELPDGAEKTEFASRRAHRYEIPSGTIAVWADDERVYTLVSDAPKRDLDALIEDLPGPSVDDVADRITEFVLAPFRW